MKLSQIRSMIELCTREYLNSRRFFLQMNK
jgi:hypothetical protein